MENQGDDDDSLSVHRDDNQNEPAEAMAWELHDLLYKIPIVDLSLRYKPSGIFVQSIKLKSQLISLELNSILKVGSLPDVAVAHGSARRDKSAFFHSGKAE